MKFNFDDKIILESENLHLKPVVRSDIDHLLPIAIADKTLLQFSPKQVYTKELLTEYFDSAIVLRDNHLRYSFSIFSKLHKCYIGSTAFLNIAESDDRLEIGATWIGRDFQGIGLNKECKYLMLGYAFDTCLVHRVEFRTDERNMQSRKAIEKIGGKFEGILREHMLMADGFRRNTFCYSILKHEWEILSQLT